MIGITYKKESTNYYGLAKSIKQTRKCMKKMKNGAE
jgi:hypothetical protein